MSNIQDKPQTPEPSDEAKREAEATEPDAPKLDPAHQAAIEDMLRRQREEMGFT